MSMKKITALLLGLLAALALWGCEKEYPAPPSAPEVLQQLQPQLEQKAASYREAWGISDLTVQARLEVFRLEPMTRDSSGDAHYLVEYYMVSDVLEEMIYNNTLTQAQINEIEEFSVKCRDFVLNGYEVTLTDVTQLPTLALAGGEVKYTFSHGVILRGDEVVYVAPDADLELPLKVGDSLQEALDNVIPLKPYVGMDVSKIDKTEMGPHAKEAYNYKNDKKGKHRCTLYYWMEGSRCTMIVRVQDDTGKVILVEENPAGSYFGN